MHRHRARAACSPACSRRCSCRASARRSRRPARSSCIACNVATQPGETGGFDLADHLDALGAARRRPPAGRRPGQQPLQRAGSGRLGGGAGPAALAAGHGARPAARPGRPRGPCQRAPSLPGPPGVARSSRPGSARAGAAGGPARHAPSARPERGRMSESDRDLVAALRAELAAVDPARPCDRLAEIAGLGPRVASREASSPASRCGSAGQAEDGPGAGCTPRVPPAPDALRRGPVPPSTADSPGCAACSSRGDR